MLKRAASLLAVLLSAVLVSACSSAVKRADGLAPAQIDKQMKYSGVSVSFTKDAKEQHKENLKFDPDELSRNVLRALESNSLIDPASNNKIEIVIKEVRVRSNFSAIMWGFMAGSDHITGNVNIKDATDNTLNSFEVSASYALGGIGGGQDDARMGWLYEKFAELTSKEITGTRVN